MFPMVGFLLGSVTTCRRPDTYQFLWIASSASAEATSRVNVWGFPSVRRGRKGVRSRKVESAVGRDGYVGYMNYKCHGHVKGRKEGEHGIPPGTGNDPAGEYGCVGECNARKLAVKKQVDFTEGTLAKSQADGELRNELIRRVIVLGIGGSG
jgi:hypothetical protein